MTGLSQALQAAFDAAGPVFAEHLLKASGKTVSPDHDENTARLGGAWADTRALAESTLAKSLAAGAPVFGPAAMHGQSVVNDPYLWQQGSPDYGQRPSSLGWGTLGRLARTPLIATIIQIRSEQAAKFARPSENPHSAGFQIKMRGTKRAPRRSEAKMIEQLGRFLSQCGTIQDVRQLQARHDLPAFVKMMVRDSLTYDQACAEIIPSKSARLGGALRPARFEAIDGSTIRVAQAALEAHGLPEDDFTTPRHVQVYEESVVNEYPLGRLMWMVRNPSTSIYRMGYGMAEGEMLIRVLTAWLNAFNRNASYFTQGYNADGILNIKKGAGAGIHETQMRSFKRELQLAAMGVQNAHRLPIVNTEGLEWVSVGNDAQEMQWPGWSDLLVKLTYAIFLMDSAEGNMPFGNGGQSSAMGGSNDAEKIEASRQRGLVPLVHSIFDSLNKFVTWPLDPDFVAVPTGVAGRDEASDLDLDAKRVKVYMTVNEIRASRDLPPLPGKQGETLLDPTFLQAAQMAGDEDDDESAAEPVDIGGLFDDPGADQDGTAGSDAGQDTPDVIQENQPLAASMRSIRRTTTIEI